jgi:hypothetical protein
MFNHPKPDPFPSPVRTSPNETGNSHVFEKSCSFRTAFTSEFERASESGKGSNSIAMGYNTLKIRVLEALDGRGWLNTAMLSHLSGLRPVNSVATYMERLRRWGLVRRRRARGRFGHSISLYAISARGKKRLMWLREQAR